jgi:hypothetical protein
MVDIADWFAGKQVPSVYTATLFAYRHPFGLVPRRKRAIPAARQGGVTIVSYANVEAEPIGAGEKKPRLTSGGGEVGARLRDLIDEGIETTADGLYASVIGDASLWTNSRKLASVCSGVRSAPAQAAAASRIIPQRTNTVYAT